MATYFDPVQALRDEHNLILARLNVFELALKWLTSSPASKAQLDSVIHFLFTGLPRHSLKEEECLFPELLAMEEFQPGWKTIMAQDREIRQSIEALKEAWEQLKHASQVDFPASRDRVAGRGERLLHILREHIYEEESLLFRFADRMLTREKKEEIARHMQHLDEQAATTAAGAP